MSQSRGDLQVHRLISFPSVQATQGVRGCVRTERNKGCPHLKKRPGPDGPSIPHVMSGPVQKSQYPSQERAVIGGAAPQKSLILTENGPFPQNFGACGGLGAGAPRRRHTSPAAARPSETGVVQPPRSDRENLLVRGLVGILSSEFLPAVSVWRPVAWRSHFGRS